MNNENRLKYYPANISDEEAAKLFKTAWSQDYERRLTWHKEGMESIAGYGTNSGAIRSLLEEFPKILDKYGIKSILDAPCGDFFIMNKLDLSSVKYIGVDLIDAQVERNRELYPEYDFRVMDMVRDELPTCDLIFSRDSLIHLSDDDILKFLNNCKKSGAKYIMTSTYPDLEQNSEMGGIQGWRFINFEKPPYSFPKPTLLINENSQTNPIKSIALWEIKNLNL